jgi:hypothetical protein
MESCQYRGYQIETRREWSNWCVSVYRTRSDIPILPRPTLYTTTPQMDEAVAEAKQSIDLLLSPKVIGGERVGLKMRSAFSGPVSYSP